MRMRVRYAMSHVFMATMMYTGCIPTLETPSDQAVDERGGEVLQAVAGVTSPGSAPAPIASLKLTSGHVVEFYDFGGAALIVEAGAAYMAPALNSPGPIPTDQLSSIWTRLAPGTPVPRVLADLQQRLTRLPASPAAPEAVASAVTGGEPMGFSRIALPTAPAGCNNGCCDAAWLETLAECQGSGWSYSWFLYNYGWATATSTNDIAYQGLVCSAQGTSTFSASIGGSSGTWNIPEATYHWFHWTAGTNILGSFNPKNLSSSVNSPTNQHLHTYCGRVLYD